jgi:hypothetical protein
MPVCARLVEQRGLLENIGLPGRRLRRYPGLKIGPHARVHQRIKQGHLRSIVKNALR